MCIYWQKHCPTMLFVKKVIFKVKMIKYLVRRIEQFVLFTIDVIYDRRRGRKALVYAAILKGFSCLYGMIVRLRTYLYQYRILRDQPLGCFVVVVGNLTVGGTGKTPVVEKFARDLTMQGRKVAILSRGYKSRNERFYRRLWRWISHGEPCAPRVVSDGKTIFMNSESAGDEPYMLARNLPGVVVLVDKNRVKSGHYAIRKFGVDTLILDDGFQYLPLRGQINLLLIDKNNPFGNQSLLPRGILREPIAHLRRASYILLTKSDGKSSVQLEQMIRRNQPDAEIIECAHRPKFLQSIPDGEKCLLAELQNKRVAVFSGIAAPESFEAFLRSMGADIIYVRRFLDHHRFTTEELQHFFREAEKEGAHMVVTTEKDAVRLAADFSATLPFYYLRLEIEIIRGGDDFNSAVERICFSKREKTLL